MNILNKLLLAGALVAAPFTVTAASAQDRGNASTMQQRQSTDRDRHDQRDVRDRRDRDSSDSHPDWRAHQRYDRHHWRGHRHCTVRWHHHRRVRVCG